MEQIQIDYLANHIEFVDELALLWQKEWSDNKSDAGFEKQRISIEKKLNTDKVPLIIIAVDGDKLTGTAALFENDLESRPDLEPWLAGVFVKEEYRGKGIASLLTRRVVEIAKKHKYQKLYLHTESAQGLYEKMGWKMLEDTVNDSGKATSVYFLTL